MSRIEENVKLLDNDGEWIETFTSGLTKYRNKIMVGFLHDSNYNVFGIMKGTRKYLSMDGYSCSHYRELTKNEIKELTEYDNDTTGC